MKKKLVMLLCACLFLAGCGGTGERNQNREPSADTESTYERLEQDLTADSEDGGYSTEPVSSDSVQETTAGAPTAQYETESRDPWVQAAYFADRIYEITGENTIVSPLSLDMALGLAAQGAEGKTAEELFWYLGGKDYADQTRTYLSSAEEKNKRAEKHLKSSKQNFSYRIANSVWADKSRKLKKEYKADAEKYYLAEVQNLDFRKSPDKAAKTINKWCEEQTEGMIPQIVRPDQLTEDTAAVLVNSVYFESPWVDKWGLREHSFTDFDGKASDLEMLGCMTGYYYENDAASAFGKDYYEGFRFIGILPKQEGEFALGDLDLQGLLASKTTEYDVSAVMPKLKFETSTGTGDIVKILWEQGVRRAFDAERAQFDRMFVLEDSETVYIDDIIQKCRLELDENGTKAAAATAILMMKNEAVMLEPKQVKEVHLDRPFAFLIYDVENEKIVFAGKVVNPGNVAE